jgi:cellulose biosynthesis protein BcsQ
MKIISVFSNKGGLGDSYLTYHIGNSLAELGHKVLMIDLDPQCNLTVCAMMEDDLHHIWNEEEAFIKDFEGSLVSNPLIANTVRTVHFMLKPTEEGLNEQEFLPLPYTVGDNLYLLPGRMSLYTYEEKITERWKGMYLGDHLSIRTVTDIRGLCKKYAAEYGYDFVLIGCSSHLGSMLNKAIISTIDGLFTAVRPDVLHLYRIRMIGEALCSWRKDLLTIYSLISGDKRSRFPEHFVQFLGYALCGGRTEEQHTHGIPEAIMEFIHQSDRVNFPDERISDPIGRVPEVDTRLGPAYQARLREDGFEYDIGGQEVFQHVGEQYRFFTENLIARINFI